ncbi:hypothetical protein BASA82_000516 [Batrachochytrium salamandrivorans]|nr:hypothetical protein BASA82_000516 [Batrachochytrium salamandrivorans]
MGQQSDAFDQLRVRNVRAKGGQTAAAVLAEFQSIAASLEPDERIKLVYTHESMESLKAMLSDPHASKICALHWQYYGKEDVNSIIPLLISNCPELASLQVNLKQSTLDFVSNVLEHPSNKIKELDMPENAKGRFFVALGQSQVSALTLRYSPKFTQGLCEYLAKDLLVRLKIWTYNEQVPSAMMVSLSKCTRLAKLEMLRCRFSQPIAFTHLPKSITKLTLNDCWFVGGFDWSFLAGSNVQELDLYNVNGVDGNQLGSALTVHLRAKGLDKLRVAYCDFVNETLAVVGVEVGRIKRLDIDSYLSDASVELIALALQSPNNEMKELSLRYDDTASSSTTHLVSALKHPNCNLIKLLLWAYESELEEATKRVNYTFYNRLALFVLLQGKQVRRRSPCPLRRLPVEMFRLAFIADRHSAEPTNKICEAVADEQRGATTARRLGTCPGTRLWRDLTGSAFERSEPWTTAPLLLFWPSSASLEPDERIKLEVAYTRENVELLKAVLADLQANKICSLFWWYEGREDVNLVLPLLINNCPELASLEVIFKHHSEFDFVSSLLEHPSNRIKVLVLPQYTTGNIPRLFAALGQSQVSVLTLFSDGSPEFAQDLCEYLAKDLLVRLKVFVGYRQVPSEMMVLLVDCTRLAKLEILCCKFSQPTAFTHLPKSITKLELHDCVFVGGFDWSFLADSNVRELDLCNVNGVDGNQLGSALADYLRAKGLNKLRCTYCGFVNETLAKVGVEIGRIKRLDIGRNLNDDSIELIALVLQSLNSELRELRFPYNNHITSSIENHLVPALKHPNCNLAELLLWAYDEHKEAAKKVEDMFHNRRALFVLLQGRQLRRLYCPLRRLPVEMLRLDDVVIVSVTATKEDPPSCCSARRKSPTSLIKSSMLQ